VRTENGVEYGDLLKFVDFDYVARVARLNAATLAVLASAPGAPTDVKIETKALDNNTTLRWAAPQGGSGSTPRYEVVWRETAAPDWQFSQPVAGLSVTLPVSKDDFIFGVRSLDAAGHRGLAVIPVPQR
jgi:hypothetical protein